MLFYISIHKGLHSGRTGRPENVKKADYLIKPTAHQAIASNQHCLTHKSPDGHRSQQEDGRLQPAHMRA